MRFLLLFLQLCLLSTGSVTRARRDASTATPEVVSSESTTSSQDDFSSLSLDALKMNLQQLEASLVALKEDAEKSKTDFDAKNEQLTLKESECKKAASNFSAAVEELERKEEPLAEPRNRFEEAKREKKRLKDTLGPLYRSMTTDASGDSAELKKKLFKYGDYEIDLTTSINNQQVRIISSKENKEEEKNREVEADENIRRTTETMKNNGCIRKGTILARKRQAVNCDELNNLLGGYEKKKSDARKKITLFEDSAQYSFSAIAHFRQELHNARTFAKIIPLLEEAEGFEQQAIDAKQILDNPPQEIKNARAAEHEAGLRKDGCEQDVANLNNTLANLKTESNRKAEDLHKTEKRAEAMNRELQRKEQSTTHTPTTPFVSTTANVNKTVESIQHSSTTPVVYTNDVELNSVVNSASSTGCLIMGGILVAFTLKN